MKDTELRDGPEATAAEIGRVDEWGSGRGGVATPRLPVFSMRYSVCGVESEEEALRLTPELLTYLSLLSLFDGRRGVLEQRQWGEP